jgi:hypothetical protein
MYFYRRLVPVTQVEQYASLLMCGFDGYSKSMRDTLNYSVIEPSSSGASLPKNSHSLQCSD